MIYSTDSFENLDYTTIKDQIEKDGYVGIGYTGKDCPVNKGDIVRWMYDLVDKNNGVPVSSHGVIRNYGAGNTPFMWKAREFVYPVFEKLWGTDKLLCSLDGFNYTNCGPRVRRNPKLWLHRDQRPENTDFEMYQGVLQFGNEGNLVVVPESHKIKIIDSTGKDWYKIPNEFKLNCEIEECISPYEITLWIWDSRTWHANIEPPVGKIRTACYVTFGPRPEKFNCIKRKEFIEKGETTSHWPHKLSKNPRPRPQTDPKYIKGDPRGKIEEWKNIRYHPWAW